jgi:vacuolar-type H+-ATPase subunit F/Vma7
VARVAAIGTETLVAGYGLAGALVLPAEDDDDVRAAWASLGEDVEVVVLTGAASRVLGEVAASTGVPLTVVLAT